MAGRRPRPTVASRRPDGRWRNGHGEQVAIAGSEVRGRAGVRSGAGSYPQYAQDRAPPPPDPYPCYRHLFLTGRGGLTDNGIHLNLPPGLSNQPGSTSHDRAAGEQQRSSVVQPAQRSPAAQKKAASKRTADDLPDAQFSQPDCRFGNADDEQDATRRGRNYLLVADAADAVAAAVLRVTRGLASDVAT